MRQSLNSLYTPSTLLELQHGRSDLLLSPAGASAFANMRVGSGTSVDQAAAMTGVEQQQYEQRHTRTPSSDSCAAAPGSPASQPRELRAPNWLASGSGTHTLDRPIASPILAASLQALSRRFSNQPAPWFQALPVRSSDHRAAQDVSAFERVLHEATAGLRTAGSLASARCEPRPPGNDHCMIGVSDALKLLPMQPASWLSTS